MTSGDNAPSPGAVCRRLIRTAAAAALATAERGGRHWPYASLVETACDHDGSPVLLLSDLADHSKNIADDDRVSLLFDGTEDGTDRLAGSRVSVQGRASRLEEGPHRARLAARYLSRHPGAGDYAEFADFDFYRVRPERAHLIGGFGDIHWLEADDFLFDTAATAALAAAEPEILGHMNSDHLDAVQRYARLAGRAGGEGWRLCGIDPEGIDLTLDHRFLRIDFSETVADPDAARVRLAALAKKTRRNPKRRPHAQGGS